MSSFPIIQKRSAQFFLERPFFQDVWISVVFRVVKSKFSNNHTKKFILLLRKGVYPYEYMDDWEKFKETKLPEKQQVYSNLNMEEITDADYMHVKRVYKDFEIKNLGEYHDLYLESDTLPLADAFENFRKMYLKIYLLYPAKFLSAPVLA